MALLALEGFELCGNTANMRRGFTSSVGVQETNWAYDGSFPRSGIACMKALAGGLGFNNITWVSGDTLISGFGFRRNALTSAFGCFIFNTQHNGSLTVSLYYDIDRKIKLSLNGVTSPFAAESPSALTLNTYYYMEIKIFYSATVGTVEVLIDGNVVMTYSGDTLQGDTDVNEVFWNTNESGDACYYDDIYLANASVDDSNIDDYLGPSTIVALRPIAAGTATELLPNGAPENWECVDDLVPDDDATFVSGYVNGDHDRYSLADLPTGAASIAAVGIRAVARKEGSETAGFALLSNADVGSTNDLTTDYANYDRFLGLNPDTGFAWTGSEINSLEAGVEVAI